MGSPDKEPLDPTLFGEGQARDDRFQVVDRWADLVNEEPLSPEGRREFLHRQMNEEVNVMEQAAQSLVDFPDVEWEIRKWLARQCCDEARHAQVYLRRMKQQGVEVGEYPVINFQFRVLHKIDSLIGRLAVENRTFEADGLDAAVHGVEEAKADGDSELAALMDAQAADELLHVGFANGYVRKKVKEDPKNILAMARALDRSARAFKIAFGGGRAQRYGVAESERLRAGFSEEEVRVAVELADERRRSGRFVDEDASDSSGETSTDGPSAGQNARQTYVDGERQL